MTFNENSRVKIPAVLHLRRLGKIRKKGGFSIRALKERLIDTLFQNVTDECFIVPRVSPWANMIRAVGASAGLPCQGCEF